MEPRWWAWWASFVPLATSTLVVFYMPRLEHPGPALGAGLALTVLSFGVVARGGAHRELRHDRCSGLGALAFDRGA